MGYDPLNMINDDDEEYGIAASMGVPTNLARTHMSAPVKEDIFTDEGKHGENSGYNIYAGVGRFFVEDEQPLVEAIIGIVAEMGMVFELADLDPDPVVDGREAIWYREFPADGEVICTVSVAYDQGIEKYRLAITNDETRTIYAVSGINTPADVVWLMADVFRYSQS